MTTPDYIKILKLDKLAMKSKTRLEFLKVVQMRLRYARNLGVEESFSYFVEQAWVNFGNGM